MDTQQELEYRTFEYLKRFKKRHFVCIIFIATFLAIVNSTLDIIALQNSFVGVKEEEGNITVKNFEEMEETMFINKTLCTFIKQFNLSGRIKLTLCHYNGLRVDIRRFIWNKPTIQGIWLNLKEWNQLVRYFSQIQGAVLNALN